MNGTETVDTSSSTAYTKEMQTIKRSDLVVGDVVQVVGTPASSGSSSASTPPPPGTGTVKATQVSVIEPTFMGRVTADSNGTLTLVGPNGQLLTVSTGASTRYYKGRTRTSSSAISIGSHVTAEGAQTGLTHLNADVVAVAPPPPAPGRAPSPPSGARSSGRSSSGSSSSTGSASSSGQSSSRSVQGS